MSGFLKLNITSIPEGFLVPLSRVNNIDLEINEGSHTTSCW